MKFLLKYLIPFAFFLTSNICHATSPSNTVPLFGSGDSDYILTASVTTLTPTYAGAAIVKQYRNITIGTGKTLKTESTIPNAGLILYANSSITISGAITNCWAKNPGYGKNGVGFLIDKNISKLQLSITQTSALTPGHWFSFYGGDGGVGGQGSNNLSNAALSCFGEFGNISGGGTGSGGGGGYNSGDPIRQHVTAAIDGTRGAGAIGNSATGGNGCSAPGGATILLAPVITVNGAKFDNRSVTVGSNAGACNSSPPAGGGGGCGGGYVALIYYTLNESGVNTYTKTGSTGGSGSPPPPCSAGDTGNTGFDGYTFRVNLTTGIATKDGQSWNGL